MEADAELWYVKEIRPLAEGNPPCIISYEEVVERAVKHFEFDDFDMPMTAIARGNGPKYQVGAVGVGWYSKSGYVGRAGALGNGGNSTSIINEQHQKDGYTW